MGTLHLSFVRESKGLEAAYSAACQLVVEREAEMNTLWNSRFFERRTLEDGSKKLWPTTEAAISRAYDLQDCEPEMPEYLYCDEDGKLYPVVVGELQRHEPDPDGPDEMPFVYGSAAMVANGKVVGHVNYTDH